MLGNRRSSIEETNAANPVVRIVLPNKNVMGAGASIPDKLDLAAAKDLAGEAFDEAK